MFSFQLTVLHLREPVTTNSIKNSMSLPGNECFHCSLNIKQEGTDLIDATTNDCVLEVKITS